MFWLQPQPGQVTFAVTLLPTVLLFALFFVVVRFFAVLRRTTLLPAIFFFTELLFLAGARFLLLVLLLVALFFAIYPLNYHLDLTYNYNQTNFNSTNSLLFLIKLD
jgi:hypothetical protein